MRRYTFYLSVALLAFGIGSFVVFKFYLKCVEQNVIAQTTNSKVGTDKSLSGNAKTKQPEFIKIELKNLPCEDKTLQIVWDKLTNEIGTINSERAGKIKDCGDVIQVDESLDLNGDGRKEIVIKGLENPFRCGNNCSKFWIFQQTKNRNYQKLFEANGYLPDAGKRKTLGYKDILFEFYASYNEFINGTYKFNGTEYVLKNCWSKTNLYKNKDGDMAEGKKWRVENYDCREAQPSQ